MATSIFPAPHNDHLAIVPSVHSLAWHFVKESRPKDRFLFVYRVPKEVLPTRPPAQIYPIPVRDIAITHLMALGIPEEVATSVLERTRTYDTAGEYPLLIVGPEDTQYSFLEMSAGENVQILERCDPLTKLLPA